jgi:hypothetical protein
MLSFVLISEVAMHQSTCLLLKEPNLLENIAELFDRLKSNTSLQLEFVNTPGKILHEAGLSRTKSEGASEVIQLLFDVLSSEILQDWLEKYKTKPPSESCGREAILRDLSNVFIEFCTVKYGSDAGSFNEPGIWAVTNISRTYAKTLNNRVTFITKIKSDTSDPPQQREISTLEIVNLAERISQLKRSSPRPVQS